MTKTAPVTPLPRPERAPIRRVFVRDLQLMASIGAYAHERAAPQPIRMELDLDVTEPADPASDQLETVVCYDKMVQGVKAILAEGHIQLVETLAERVAAMALAHPMVLAARVRVEKPNAIDDAAAVGVEIERRKA
ncbi:MAG: dihydroneopterin aldolase [Pseudomonadota bacterium]